MLEVVDERDHGAAVDPQRDAQRLLGLTLGGGEVAEHPEVPRMEVDSGEALGEAPMRVGAELGEQEAETPAQFRRRGRRHLGGLFGHLAMIPRSLNCFCYKQLRLEHISKEERDDHGQRSLHHRRRRRRR